MESVSSCQLRVHIGELSSYIVGNWQRDKTKFQRFCCGTVMVPFQFRTGSHWGAAGDEEREFGDQVGRGPWKPECGVCVLPIDLCDISGPPVWDTPGAYKKMPLWDPSSDLVFSLLRGVRPWNLPFKQISQMILIPLLDWKSILQVKNLVKNHICMYFNIFCPNDNIFMWCKQEKKNTRLLLFHKLTLELYLPKVQCVCAVSSGLLVKVEQLGLWRES